MKKQKIKLSEKTDKNSLDQEEIKEEMKTFETEHRPHAALETAEGKNNGAKPAAYNNQQSNHP